MPHCLGEKLTEKKRKTEAIATVQQRVAFTRPLFWPNVGQLTTFDLTAL